MGDVLKGKRSSSEESMTIGDGTKMLRLKA